MELWKFHSNVDATDDLKDVLYSLGIVSGDSLCVHGELCRFGVPMLSKICSCRQFTRHCLNVVAQKEIS